MIGAMSSSLALAQRTATKARATMDDMTRQIATGQRVSSVKDDGAAWARAAEFRGRIVGTEAVRTNLARLQAVFEINAAAIESRNAMLEPLRDTALAAMNPSLSAEARAALQAAQNIPPSPAGTIGAASHEQRSNNGAAFTVNNLDAANQLTILISQAGDTQTFQGSGLPTGAVGSVTDLSTPATAATARQLIEDSLAVNRNRLAYWGGVASGLQRWDRHLSRDQDRLHAAVGSLTDADLGAASAQLRKSEVRQQLALDTIRTAINAYGNFAGGLLGNVMQTQRAIA